MAERENDAAPWQVLGKRTIYSSEWITLQRWSVRLPDGSVISDHHVLDFPREAVALFLGETSEVFTRLPSGQAP
ncbi:MAG TPA: hypothetical protein VJ793_24525 [Anaerolineae bacterium]|nr:hypothetical protein [Anaerolineae bacterium]